ncbi:MAG: glycosyltransferase family 4 protein [Bacteroidales bacterium]|nr:glycosyltransferase family 4 protein [Bacteroidales bacterium]NLK80814.1 glycosyltransferase family 4 protein [Bacteroidales bacterium]
MNIAINTRFLIKDKLEGIGRFTFETIKRICINNPEHTFYLLFDRMYDKEFVFATNVKPVIIPFQARHPLLWKFWFHFQVPRVIRKINPDVFISTDGYVPRGITMPIVNVIHDLNFEHNPHHVPKGVLHYYKKYFPLYAQTSTRIATVSEFSKQDIMSKYAIPESNIDVVYNGVSSVFKPLRHEQKQIVKQQFTNGNDFFVYVGSLHPRKNIERLFEAFEQFKRTTLSPLALVIVGEAMFMSKKIQSAFAKNAFKHDIIFTGRVPDETLAKLIASAYALTYVPLFEGFGIPLLEAFACDVPVITSNCTSMPEVVGGAALLCDPKSSDDIMRAMIRITEDPEIRKQLIEKAAVQRQKFSWDITAEKLWESVLKSVSKD